MQSATDLEAVEVCLCDLGNDVRCVSILSSNPAKQTLDLTGLCSPASLSVSLTVRAVVYQSAPLDPEPSNTVSFDPPRFVIYNLSLRYSAWDGISDR